MSLRVVGEVGGRFDDRLAATPAGIASATPRAVTWWAITNGELEPVEQLVVAADVRGPLVWLEAAATLGWGPTIVDDGHPRWSVDDVVAMALTDLGAGAPRVYEAVAGAVAGEGAQVAVALAHLRSRAVAARASRPPGPPSRLAVVAPDRGAVVQVLREGGPSPTAMAWAGGPLFIATPGQLEVWGGAGDPAVFDLGATTAARCLEPAGGGVLAGTAHGDVVVVTGPPWSSVDGWVAHEGPVLALSRAADGAVASGGADGWVRVWSGGESVAEIDLGGPVDALVWHGEGTLVAKAGGPGGRIAPLALF